ncbi:MAG: hypothetical protein A2493_01870 [Candidatus Magasanikbacteria bacterium RIFOXYC12_FULL_33_11]|uniref:Capsule polysaccharide biosynthesis protein n=1 Tax=Candidatus Magasanikbacteria bacterium RIFOXYC12_FULL_33_11 TaxID=1798701 RepID=A0A1F6NLS2_9BACT|nr:MAG: hypothetical protein A2493_01870 [Candidatus Magasanikbacteria bacterium RIFOXYC12_FULL_33_11]
MINNSFFAPKDFLDINQNFWTKIPDYNTSFLIDLTVVDHEYLNVHLITMRALVDILKAKPVALVFSSNELGIISLAKSYGINDFVYVDDFEISFLSKLGLSVRAVLFWLFARTKNKLLNIKYKGDIVGHFVYDTFLASTGLGTIKWWDIRFAKYLRFGLILYKKFQKVFSQRKYILFLGSEQIYVGSGISSLVALKHGIKILYRKHGPNRVSYKKYSNIADLDLFPTHPDQDDFKNMLKGDTTIALQWMNSYITNLFGGVVSNYDWNAKNAYSNAQKLNEGEYQIFFDKKYKYHVFIFSHVFVDAVHGYREGLFPDYETWLRETLKIASKRKDVMWIIKPHPSDNSYKTKSSSVTVYKDFAHFDNIKLFPPSTLTSNLVDNIDAVLTMRGTVVGEYSCIGVPVFTAGRSPFDEGGFCITPKNIGEYRDLLLHTKFERLSDEIVKRAKIYMYVYHNYGRISMPLFNDLESVQSSTPSREEIYNHLLFKMKKMDVKNVLDKDYKEYIFNKLNKV